MAIQEDNQELNDSTMREVAEIIECHNKNLRDQEAATLCEELDNLKYLLVMKVKTLKVREASNQILTLKHKLVDRECKKQVNAVNNELEELKSFINDSTEENRRTKVKFRKAVEDWERKEESLQQEIENMSYYINDLHSTLDRNFIFNDQYIEETDASESDVFEVDWNEFLSRPDDYDHDYDSDTQFGDDDDNEEFEHQFQHRNNESNQDVFQAFQNDDLESNHQDVEEHDQICESSQNEDQAVEIDCVASNVEVQCSAFVQAIQHTDGHFESFVEPMASESDMLVSSVELSEDKPPQMLSWCDIIDAEDSGFDQQSTSIELVHFESSASDSTCYNVDVKCQEASSTSNSRTGDKAFEADKPIEPEVPMKINMDPFIHGYVEKKCEESKLKSKPKKQRKPKSKPKFKNLAVYSGY
ncbi:unnamed protein product [Chironomus riparius]|uniref:Uncharacterized protein n=1 Tax=Chironomus riparius TaxID=315576 RepID=A0A9N9RY01_9DIPT|nr:unnamed protein product [Chironomus riparius]